MSRHHIPDALKVIKGTNRPDRASRPVSLAEQPLPDPPEHLAPEAAAVWRELAPHCQHLRHPDALMFELACNLYAEFCNAPGLPASRLALLRNVLSDLGLTPLSRQRMPIMDDPNNPFDEF